VIYFSYLYKKPDTMKALEFVTVMEDDKHINIPSGMQHDVH